MSRSWYSEDCDGWALIRWRGAVKAAIRGGRGQSLMREALAALDAMPVKELYAGELEANGCYCTLGVVGKARGIDLEAIDSEDPCQVAKMLDIAPALAREIVFENDEAWSRHESPGARWARMRAWVETNLENSK